MTSNSIPETPSTTTKVSFTQSSSQGHNTSRLDGSATDPITLIDSDSSDDSEPEIVPLRKRIGIGSMESLTPFQAAGAAALRRLNGVKRMATAVDPPPNLESDSSTCRKKDTSRPQVVRQAAGSKSEKANREQLKQTPSANESGLGSSRSLSRPGPSQRAHPSTTTEQPVDLSSPEFVLRPGKCILNIMNVHDFYYLICR